MFSLARVMVIDASRNLKLHRMQNESGPPSARQQNAISMAFRRFAGGPMMAGYCVPAG